MFKYASLNLLVHFYSLFIHLHNESMLHFLNDLQKLQHQSVHPIFIAIRQKSRNRSAGFEVFQCLILLLQASFISGSHMHGKRRELKDFQPLALTPLEL
jgi:hypothetical protein